MKDMKKTIALVLGCSVLAAALAGCGATVERVGADITTGITDSVTENYSAGDAENSAAAAPDARTGASAEAPEEGGGSPFGGFPGEGQTVTTDSASQGPILDGEEEFSKRDLSQTADLSEAETITPISGQEISISAAGVYVLTGTAENCTVIVDAGNEDKVQLVLDGVSITNADFPCIYVKNADKTFITTAQDSVNTLTVTGSFRSDGETNTDAAIYARDDLTLNGLGTLNVSSTENGISCKDDLKVTGGTLSVSCAADALEAKDSIRVAGGSITLVSGKDGLHAENEDDDSLGYVYISGGTLDIRAADDGIHAVSILQLDGGELSIQAAEGLEGTYVQLNGGTLTISASDDGINAARQSGAYTPTIEVNGGDITVNMGSGDTDALDSNGNLYVNGGTLSITAQSPFDYDGIGQLNGGTVTVNGQEVTVLTNQFGGMGGSYGGFGGSFGGQPGGDMGGNFGGQPDGSFGGSFGGRPGGDMGGWPGEQPGGMGKPSGEEQEN